MSQRITETHATAAIPRLAIEHMNDMEWLARRRTQRVKYTGNEKVVMRRFKCQNTIPSHPWPASENESVTTYIWAPNKSRWKKMQPLTR